MSDDEIKVGSWTRITDRTGISVRGSVTVPVSAALEEASLRLWKAAHGPEGDALVPARK